MSVKIEVRRTPGTGTGRGRSRRSQGRTQGMSRATERIGPAARQARETTSYRITGARTWSAPVLERVGNYVERRLGPGIASFLSAMSRRIEPSRPDHRSRNTALMALGAISLLGVLCALLTRRGITISRSTEDVMEPTPEPTPMESRQYPEGRLHST